MNLPERMGVRVLLVLMFVSGMAALIYEVLWSKYLILIFGSTVQAQTIVLSVFMLGLAGGSHFFGKWAERIQQPVSFYGCLEILIGIYGFLFCFLYPWVDSCFLGLGQFLLGHSGGLFFLKLALSFVLLLPPTLIMGGTLPVLVKWLKELEGEKGNWVSLFYALNSLGAMMGALLAGFFMIRHLGLSLSIWTAAAANIGVGITALALDHGFRGDTGKPVKKEVSETLKLEKAGWREWIVFLSGGISMGLEVLASRSLSLIYGASSQAFSIVLIAFILGIGIAGILVSHPRFRTQKPENWSGIAMLGAAGIIFVLILGIEKWVDIYRLAVSGLARSNMGYVYYLLLISLLTVLVLGVPAALLGSILPLWMRKAAAEKKNASGTIGRLLAWNTMGSVGGVLVMGLILMPQWGLRISYGAAVLALAAGSAFLFFRQAKRIAGGVTLILIVLIAIPFLKKEEDWKYVFSAGVFRYRDQVPLGSELAERRKNSELLFYQDGFDATVSVEKKRNQSVSPEISLRINGKTDASNQGDLSTQYLLGHLPMIARPESKNVFILGFGSGITGGAVLGHPVDLLTICENCAPVLETAKFFEPWNRNVLKDPRTRVWVEDARTVLKLEDVVYDVIISEPSNPWMVGIGNVFSLEFYQLAASRLKEDGIMAQWLHIYEINDEIVSMVIRTFRQVFPQMEIWDSQNGDLILLGSKKEWPSDPESYGRFLKRVQPSEDLKGIGLNTGGEIWARQLASQKTSFAIGVEGEIQTDEIPVLEFDAPKAFFLGKSSRMLQNFDERTSQMDLASSLKRDVLSRLNDESLRSIFGKFGSVNEDIRRGVARVMKTGDRKSIPNEPDHGTWIFEPAGLRGGAVLSSEDSWAARMLMEERFLHDPSRREAALLAMENRLGQWNEKENSSSVSPSYFCIRAAQVCIALREWDRASRLILLGFKMNPNSETLKYLARIVETRKDQESTKDPFKGKG